MVQKHIGRARGLRRREIADDAVESKECLCEIALEMAIENLGGAADSEIVDDSGFCE
jgi:hypothetical protein